MTNTEDIIKAVADQAKNQDDEKKEEIIQLVVFSLDNEEYAVEIKDLQEIIKRPEITPVPGTPEFIKGIFNLRGKIIVVLDLENRFNLIRSTVPSREGNIIIAEINSNSFGIIVDKVTEIINIPISTIQQTPAMATSKIQTDYLKGVVVLSKTISKELKNHESENSRLIILLDLPKMLQEKELMSLQKLTSK
jgi:purine-binding chemotaxis protein CheW